MQNLFNHSKLSTKIITTMLWNYSVLQTVLSALTLSGLATPSSEYVPPAGPANMLPEVLGRYEYLSTYFSILKVCQNSISGSAETDILVPCLQLMTSAEISRDPGWC